MLSVARRDLQADGNPLVGPCRRQVHQSPEPETARKPSLDGGCDKGWVQEGERQGLTDRSFGSVPVGCERSDGESRFSDQTVERCARLPVGGHERSSSLKPHRPKFRLRRPVALDDFSPPLGRHRRPGYRDILRVLDMFDAGSSAVYFVSDPDDVGGDLQAYKRETGLSAIILAGWPPIEE